MDESAARHLRGARAVVKKAPTKATGLLGAIIVGAVRAFGDSGVDSYVQLGRTADDLVRHAAFKVLRREVLDTWSAPREFPKRAKALGIDVKKILDAAAPPVEGEKAAEAKPASKKTAKRTK